MSVVPIPDDLQRRYRNSRERRAWLASLPDLLDTCLSYWQLTPDTTATRQVRNGSSGIVVPVLTHAGIPAILKVAYPYPETLAEPVALELWNGRGAVELLRSDRPHCAMLLERLDADKWLQDAPMDQAIAAWGTVMRQLCIEPDGRPQWDELPHLAATAERWSDELPEQWELLGRPFERWLLEAALEVCQIRGAVGRRSGTDVLVHTDLHFMNVLPRPGSDTYAAIDPQPGIGEAEFAVAPCLWNRLDALPQRNAGKGLQQRCRDLSDAAGLDAEAARQWSVLREVGNALAYLAKEDHADDAARSLWVASTLAGRTMAGLPEAHQLKRL
jgi:streptomycin 6-kinase